LWGVNITGQGGSVSPEYPPGSGLCTEGAFLFVLKILKKKNTIIVLQLTNFILTPSISVIIYTK
jgi:hypothetical protein